VATKLIVAGLTISVLLWPRTATAPVAASPPPVDSVTVEHELVRVVPLHTSPPPPPTVRRNRPQPTRLAAVQRATNPLPARGVVERTKRAFFGDGRYRPEPFPRPGR
jgi:hypothetical protein